jgi:hypothetical protein
MRWMGNVARMGKNINQYGLGEIGYTDIGLNGWIILKLKEFVWESVVRINLARDRDKWQILRVR